MHPRACARARARRDAERHTTARCQRAITNSEGGRSAATLYARRRILHSVFGDTMGRGVRVLKYEYEYGGCAPRPADEDEDPRERRSMSFPVAALLIFLRAVAGPPEDSVRPNSAGIVAGNCRVHSRNADEAIVSDVLQFVAHSPRTS